MKKILINARFLCRKVTGVERYARELIKVLVMSKDYDYLLMTPKGEIIDPLPNVTIIQDKSFLKGHFWEQIRLPYLVRKFKADFLWSPCNVGPVSVKNQIVTIHDASVFVHPECFSRKFVFFYRPLLSALGKKARRILTDSHFSKKELVKYKVAGRENIRVIYNGVSFGEQKFNAIIENFLVSNTLEKEYILFAGSLEPRKNLCRLLQAWELLQNKNELYGINLCIAGGFNRNFARTIDSKYINRNVIMVGQISDGELNILYKNAKAFIYPSLYEGFSHPPLEAMACGCPVLVSNAASLPEVCGDAAYYVNPYSIESIAEGIYKVLTDEELRQSLIRKGLERVKMFSWEKTARETLKVFQESL